VDNHDLHVGDLLCHPVDPLGSGAVDARSGGVDRHGKSALLLFPALWLLGVGWSFGLIGGSNLLVDSIPIEARVQIQGTADFLMSLCGGIAGFSSGFIRRAVGFHMLSNIACVLAFVMFLVVQKAQRNRAASSAPVL
jgi:hypothetical protein